MRVCGVEIASHDAVVALLDVDLDAGSWSVVTVKQAKIHLRDEFDTDEVRRVGQQVTAFLRQHGVERVAIKKQTVGKFASRPAAHRLVTLFQLGTTAEVTFVPAQSLEKQMKDVELTDDLRKYQRGAALTAISATMGA